MTPERGFDSLKLRLPTHEMGMVTLALLSHSEIWVPALPASTQPSAYSVIASWVSMSKLESEITLDLESSLHHVVAE